MMSGMMLREWRWGRGVDVRPFLGYDCYDDPMQLIT